jgi:uncharacterized protein YbjT (DUF2867 family)
MEKSGKIILVTGATGRQGSAVVRHLLKNQWTVKALSRTPESALSRKIKDLGVEVIKGDMSDPDSLQRAMKGCYGVYSVQNYFEYGGIKEIQYGKNMADAAKNAGVSHFIYNSVGGADRNSGVDHFETKFVIENHIRKIGIPSTIFRPVVFMENYYIIQVYTGLLKGKLQDPVSGNKKLQTIAVDDIGRYVALAFEQPEKFKNLALEIAGDEITNLQRAEIFTKVMGKHVKFSRLPMVIVRLFMGKEMLAMFKWFNRAGFEANIEWNKRNFPEVKPMDLETWLTVNNWDRWNKKGSI